MYEHASWNYWISVAHINGFSVTIIIPRQYLCNAVQIAIELWGISRFLQNLYLHKKL